MRKPCGYYIYDENLQPGIMSGQSQYSDPLFGTRWVCLTCFFLEESKDTHSDIMKPNEEHIVVTYIIKRTDFLLIISF